MWGEKVTPCLTENYYISLLKNKTTVKLEDAIFRNEKAFKPGNLNNHKHFWETVILKDHPFKDKLLGWISGVTIEEFLNPSTTLFYQGVQMTSVHPKPFFQENYVPAEYSEFMTTTLREWESMGVIQNWKHLPDSLCLHQPIVVCPLGIEPEKPRAIWDGRYLNEFIKDTPFSMDNAAKVAEVAWIGAYMFKLDHKNGFFHVCIAPESRKFFGIYWKGQFYVLCVLPFGWKSSPYIYHTLTEAVNMYARSIDIPMLGWIDDMLGFVQRMLSFASDEEQFQSCLRSMVTITYIMFMAGYFLGLSKCKLIPEKVMTYLGIECDTIQGRFRVPEKRVNKYLPLLRKMLHKSWIDYATLEKMVGKLVSLECAVLTGMWYTREFYSALKLSGTTPTDTKHKKASTFIQNTPILKEEITFWIYLLQTNTGASWRTYDTVLVKADISSDASGRQFAGIVDIQHGPTHITAGNFPEEFLQEDIQVKEAEALKQTLSMIVDKIPHQVKGKCLICKVDNLVLKAVLERQGTSANLFLNSIGKQIFWLQQLGDFRISIQYVLSEENKADFYTRQSPGLEATLNRTQFLYLWNQWGPFHWDLMASAANVQQNPDGINLRYFSRFYDKTSAGTDLFLQKVDHISHIYCFPPIPIIGMVLKFLEQNKLNCVLIIPAINASWVNLVSIYISDLILLAPKFDPNVFTILNNEGKKVPKQYNCPMIAVKLDFHCPCNVLKNLYS